MKKIVFLFLGFGLILGACRNNDDDGTVASEQISFGFSLPEGPTSGRVSGDDTPASLRITIENSSGEVVLDNADISIIETAQGFVSDPVELPPGSNYSLTSFFVLNEDENAIYATPLEGSVRAELVEDPLPIFFDVITNEVNNVNVEVLSLEGANPSDFGFVVFPFTIIETFFFEIAVFERDIESGVTNLISADLSISSDADVILTKSLVNEVNLIEVRDNLELYEVTISKAGFQQFERLYSLDELKAFSPGEGILQVFLNANSGPTSGNFIDSGQRLFTSTGSTEVSAGDLDGDGDIDVFVTHQTANRVWINDGGIFTVLPETYGTGSSTDVQLADLDNDNDLDAVVGNFQPVGCEIWINNGSASFVKIAELSNGGLSTEAVATGDIDDDGDIDIVLGNYGANYVYKNNGDASFSFSSSLGSFTSSEVILEDLDMDSDIDLLVSNFSTGPNRIYYNDGLGNFSVSGVDLGSIQYNQASVGDFNNDGLLDLLFAGAFSDRASIYFNSGSGSYNRQTLGDLPMPQIEGFGVGDFDSDGDLDYYGVSVNAPDVVFLNDGSGNFINNGQALGGNNNNYIQIADFNNDGILDSFIANSSTTGHSIYFGER